MQSKIRLFLILLKVINEKKYTFNGFNKVNILTIEFNIVINTVRKTYCIESLFKEIQKEANINLIFTEWGGRS